MTREVQLITAKGLAARFQLSENWVRVVMGRKGAPDEVPVEGGGRPAIYVTEQAVPWVAGQIKARTKN